MVRVLGPLIFVGVIALACGDDDGGGGGDETGGTSVGGGGRTAGQGGAGLSGGKAGRDQGGGAGRGASGGASGGSGGTREPSAGMGASAGSTGVDAGSGGVGGDGASGGTAGSDGLAGSGGEAGDGPCPGCNGGACLSDGTCVECTLDEHCTTEAPRCDLSNNTCVECLPETDNCPDGSYCAPDLTCVPGCKDDASCASGVCSDTRDCERCLSDDECAGGRVCATGSCLEPCETEGEECGEGRTCCGGRCIDPSRDIANCGACAVTAPEAACDAGEFCSGTACASAVIANVCSNARVAVIRGSLPPDDPSGDLLGQAFAACPTPPVVRTVSQSEPILINPTTGQPVIGPGELVAVAGGPAGQAIARYLEDNRIASVRHLLVEQNFEIHRSSDDAVLASMPAVDSTETHDFALVEVVRDTASGTLVLIVSGFHRSGTAAGAWYFANQMMPSLESFPERYYLYRWTDAGDPGPDSPDEFELLSSGS